MANFLGSNASWRHSEFVVFPVWVWTTTLSSISGTPHPQDQHLVDPLPVQGDPQKSLGRYYLATASELKLIASHVSKSGSQVTEYMVKERNGLNV